MESYLNKINGKYSLHYHFNCLKKEELRMLHIGLTLYFLTSKIFGIPKKFLDKIVILKNKLEVEL